MELPPSPALDVDLELLRSGIRLMALRAGLDSDAADDVAQESMARAMDVFRNPERTANIGAYVAGIGRHVIADHFRVKSRTVSIHAVDSDTLRHDGVDALSALCAESDVVRVRDALAELADDDRELLRLCYFEGLTPSEVAARLGVPPERIRQRKLRALLRLRAAFDDSTPAGHARSTTATINAAATNGEDLGSPT